MVSANEAANPLSSTASCNICGSAQLTQYRTRSDGVNVIPCAHCGMNVIEERPSDWPLSTIMSNYGSATGSEHSYADHSYTAEHGVADRDA
jgi:hypothetical protein